jgi:hypothetical protein
MDEIVRIFVMPVDGGWSVDCALIAMPLMFLSGARAEEKARALGVFLSGLGSDARVLVHDRQRALIGTAHYFAPDNAAS